MEDAREEPSSTSCAVLQAAPPQPQASSSTISKSDWKGLMDPDDSSPTGGSTEVPLLPPCRVCGEKASGLHYGVNTCEACKGFFRRSLQRKTPYKCDKDKQCQIAIGRRNSCAHCRLVKCHAVGMSKEAIKTGRYTHAKRTKDTQEVKRLQFETPKFEGEDERLRMLSGFKKLYPSPQEYAKDMQKFIDVVNETMANLGENTIISPNDMTSTVDKFWEDYMLQIEIFGEMQPLSPQEYMAFYKSTGIDIDHRRQLVVDWTNMAEIGVRKMIKFAKTLPGFQQVPLSDQINLIKGARFEVGIVAIHKRFIVDKECFVTPRGIVRHKTEMQKLFNERSYLDGVFLLAKRLQELELTIAETVCLMAITLFSPDRSELENRSLVESSQKLYLDIIQYSFKANHPKRTDLVGKLFTCLVQLREMNEVNVKIIANVKLDWHGDIAFPELVRELTDHN